MNRPAGLDELKSVSVRSAGRARRVLYVQYTNPCAYPPLLHSSAILAGRGWEVLFLGTQSHGFETAEPPARANLRFRYLGHCPPGFKQKLHYAWFCLWCSLWAFRWKPDWVYASDPFSCLPALLLHWLFGTRFVYHEHDSPPEIGAGIHGAGGSSFGLFRWARQRTAQLAEFCILPNENRAQVYRKRTGTSKEVKVVWNTPLRSEVPAPKRRPNAALKLLYHGSIVPERLPLAVVQALQKVGYPVVLHVVGYETIGSLGYIAKLRASAEELGLANALEFVGVLQRDELMAYCGSCDVGLAVVPPSINDPNLGNLMGASNKVFDYLACGLALLIPEIAGWEELLPYGLACDPMDPDSVAGALRYFCEHRDEMRLRGERGRQRILEKWNYEAHFQPVWERMENEPAMAQGARAR